MTTESPSLRGDPWTIGGIAALAYSAAVLIHEGGGHGGACLLVHGKPAMLNAIFFQCDDDALSVAAQKWVAAGGSVLNVLVAAALWPVMRAFRQRPGPAHFFVWLLFALNVLMPAGYLMFSGVLGVGDWARVIDGLEPHLLWRGVLALLGFFLYFWVAAYLVMPDMNVYLGQPGPERVARARTYGLLPYLVGGTSKVLTSLLNPIGLKLVLISAAASTFGGTILLARYPAKSDAYGAQTAPTAPATIPRSNVWIALGAIALCLEFAVLGRGIRF